MWRICAKNNIKLEELLQANHDAMHEVVLSISDPILKDQVCYHEDYEAIDSKQDTLGTLRVIKKVMYSNGDDDMHMWYNHMVANTN